MRTLVHDVMRLGKSQISDVGTHILDLVPVGHHAIVIVGLDLIDLVFSTPMRRPLEDGAELTPGEVPVQKMNVVPLATRIDFDQIFMNPWPP